MMSDSVLPMPEGNLRSTDRILKLEPIDGKPKNVLGMVDTRMFTGKQNLHVKMDPQTTLWTFQYSNQGLLPEPLKGHFTTFSKAYDFAEGYFLRRNVKITEVKD